MNKKFFAYRIMGMNVVNPITLNTLRGVLYLPELTGRVPLVITAHELATNYRRLWPAYGENLASLGIAVYSFDFAGGGPKAKVERAPGNRSDGNTTEMSVMTELKDMETVLDSAKTWPFIDGKKIALIGGSQGAVVSLMTAARHIEEVSGLVMLYPGLAIQDKIHAEFKDWKDCPPVYSLQEIGVYLVL